MGSGCSSPLRRRGKKAKNRESFSIEGNVNSDEMTIEARMQADQRMSASGDGKKLPLDNEYSAQSETNEDHPSTTSCQADNSGEKSTGCDEPSPQQHQAQTANSDVAKISALAAHVPIDRNLLISPALSPAPSISQSPAPPSSASSAQQLQAKQRIFTIKDNHRHVVALNPDKGTILVWDIYDEKIVRTISNVDLPRDLRMIDQKRAVVLCNRELRVYDLDSGNLLTKLKGLMNQKMPYFEVFGTDYVVALARNRMYVNMLNLNTGELETTFKVGEDRFLNSLLVSTNGGICCCGDETQKPFPLLVWNLNERRLMYDLRLDKHEFIMRMSAISDDGHFVVSVCKQVDELISEGTQSVSVTSISTSASSVGLNSHKSAPNFIVIYDLSLGTLFKKWKPGLDSCGVAISQTENRSAKVMNALIDTSILVWDLGTGSKKHTLTGHSAPADILRVQGNRMFSMDSSSRDPSLRIWDIDEGHCIAVFTPDTPVACCQMSMRGDALVCGFGSDSKLKTFVENESNDNAKRNKRRKPSKPLYVFDEPPSRKSS